MKTYLPSEKIHQSNQPSYAYVRIKSMPRSPGHSTRSALYIFNQHHVLLIPAFWLARQNLECMNVF